MVYVVQVCWQLASRIRTDLSSVLILLFADSLRPGSVQNWVPFWSYSQAVSKPVWHIPLLCVQWKTPDDGHRNCPKHVEFYSKNKLEELVHLVGFIIRTTIFYYLIYWLQVSVIRPSSGHLYLKFKTSYMSPLGTAVAQWLRCCATNRKVALLIPAGVSGFFIDIKYFRSYYDPGVDSASNRNE